MLILSHGLHAVPAAYDQVAISQCSNAPWQRGPSGGCVTKQRRHDATGIGSFQALTGGHAHPALASRVKYLEGLASTAAAASC